MTLGVRSNCRKILVGELKQGLRGWTTLNLHGYGYYVVIKPEHLAATLAGENRGQTTFIRHPPSSLNRWLPLTNLVNDTRLNS